ncbi:MAG TPA: DUF5700 domain-containing putative Zn-dependent protease [Candidatus Eisenbacteria bacterium]
MRRGSNAAVAAAALVALLAALAGDSSPCAARGLTASDVEIGTAPAAEVLALWKDGAMTDPAKRRRAVVRIGTSAPYRMLREFQGGQNRCVISDDDFARALLYPDSGSCGLSFYQAREGRASIDSLVREVARRVPALRGQIAAQVSRYLPDANDWKPIRIWFVVSSRWSFDAMTRRWDDPGEGDEPIVLVNATDVMEYGNSTEERMAALEHVLAHESFHAALWQIQGSLPGWDGYRSETPPPFVYIARVVLDEGVAHYIDWRTRPGSDTLFVAKPGPRETHAFSQLALACKRIRERTGDFGSRMEVLQLASTGPLWSKYGAISGMFAAYRIESKLGVDSLRAAVQGGPPAFFRIYRGLAAADTTLKGVPDDLAPQR